MPRPRIVELKRAIIQAASLNVLTRAVAKAVDGLSYGHYMPSASYATNADAAELHKHYAVADCLREAHHREKFLRQLPPPAEEQLELDV